MLSGEAALVVEGEERPLRQWDFVHCPPKAKHTIIGGGSGPCLVVAIGARDRSVGSDWGGYTVDEAAARHGASVKRARPIRRRPTRPWRSASATSCRDGWLPTYR